MTLFAIVLLSLITVHISTAKFVEYVADPLVHIDGYTHNTTLESGDTIQLGTTVILVCTVTGIPYGVQTSYRWTCPHGTCNIEIHILKIPLISTRDGGNYTCTVLVDGINKSAVFTFTAEPPKSGFIVTSQNRILDDEAVITNITEIAGDQEIGEIQCRSYNGGNATWVRPGYTIPASSTKDVYKSENGTTASLFIKRTSNTSDDYYCSNSTYGGSHYINLYLSNNTLPIPSMMMMGFGRRLLRMKISGGTGHDPTLKYVTRYDRLDLGVPVEIGHIKVVNNKVSLSVVPGGLFRVKVWIISGQNISSAPNETTYRAKSSVPTKPRHLTITRVCKDGVELNWMPPREPNGKLHYIIQYGSNTTNTTSNLTYYNLTGLVNGTTYYITVMAVNSAENSTSDVMEYTYNTSSNSTCTSTTPRPTSATPGITTVCSSTLDKSEVTPNTVTEEETSQTPSPSNHSTDDNSQDIPISTTYLTDDNSQDIPISAISGAAGAVLLLVIIIITIVVLILCVSTRRKRNNTGKTPHYSTTTHTRNTSSGGPKGDYDDEPQVKAAQQHTAHTTTSFSVYDDIDTKPDKRNDIEQFVDPMYEDVDMKKGEKKKALQNGKGKDEVPSIDPSDLYAMPNKIKKKKLQEVDNSDQLYAQPDKAKKKGKKETPEEQEKEEHEKEDVLQYEPSADSEEEEVPQIPLFDPELLYSTVNK